MPAAVLASPLLAAGVTAAGAVAGGAMAAGANKKATKENARAQAEALAFQREEAAREEASRLRAEEMQRQQWDAYQAMREPYRRAAALVLQRYGLGGGGSSAPPTMPAGWSPSDVSAGVNARKSYAELAATPSTPALVAPRLTLADLSNWSKTPYRSV